MAKWDRAVERIRECPNIRNFARELQVSRQMLYEWKYQVESETAKKRPKPPTSANSPGMTELKRRLWI